MAVEFLTNEDRTELEGKIEEKANTSDKLITDLNQLLPNGIYCVSKGAKGLPDDLKTELANLGGDGYAFSDILLKTATQYSDDLPNEKTMTQELVVSFRDATGTKDVAVSYTRGVFSDTDSEGHFEASDWVKVADNRLFRQDNDTTELTDLNIPLNSGIYTVAIDAENLPEEIQQIGNTRINRLMLKVRSYKYGKNYLTYEISQELTTQFFDENGNDVCVVHCRSIDYYADEDSYFTMGWTKIADSRIANPYIFDVEIDDSFNIITETTYADIKTAYDEGEQIYVRAKQGDYILIAPLHSKTEINFIFEAFNYIGSGCKHIFLYCYDDGYTTGWDLQIADNTISAEDIDGKATYVQINELDDSKEIRVFTPSDIVDDNGIYETIELYDKEQVDAKLLNQEARIEEVSAIVITEYVKNTDYATKESAGVVKVDTNGTSGTGVYITSNGVIAIAAASESVIAQKESYSRPITPANLEYAVEVCTNQDLDAELTEAQLKLPPSTAFVNNLVSSLIDYVDNAIGDIDTALENIISKYGLGDESNESNVSGGQGV